MSNSDQTGELLQQERSSFCDSWFHSSILYSDLLKSQPFKAAYNAGECYRISPSP